MYFIFFIACGAFTFINRVLMNERYSNYIDTGFYYNYFCKDVEQYMFREQMEEYIELIPDKSNVLDFGCGPGIMSEFFNNTNYYGVDIDKTRILRAKQIYGSGGFAPEENVRPDVVREFVLVSPAPDLLPFSNDFFDVILISDVLHHINTEDAIETIQELNRVLRRDGIIFVREPRRDTNFITWFITYITENGFYIRKDVEYLRLFDLNYNKLIHMETDNFYGLRDYLILSFSATRKN